MSELSFVDKLLATHQHSQAIVEALFKMERQQLIEVLKSIFGVLKDQDFSHLLCNESVIQKTLINDIPHTIEIFFYDAIRIDANGIWFIPEHGNTSLIRSFDLHFTL